MTAVAFRVACLTVDELCPEVFCQDPTQQDAIPGPPWIWGQK